MDLLNSTIIFIVINVIFFSLLFAYVARAGNSASFYEQVYSKKIALLIDNSQPGSLINVNIDDLAKFMEEDSLSEGDVVKIRDNKVNINLIKNGKGYSTSFFSDYKIEHSFKKENNSLFLIIYILEDEYE